jgi:transcriptional regulator with XRE-family HTH domain
MLDFVKIRAIRMRQGLTQEAAAKRAGLPSRATWNDIEKGRRINITMETLDAIAEALKVKPAELIK